ncbi:MAG: DUF4011 domain-containing protein [Pirellulales bacterium]
MRPESETQPGDRDLELDPEYLNGLNEAERGELHFTLTREGTVLAEATHKIRVLARDEWGGCHSMGELLGAFVMPNDPAIAGLLKQTGEVLDKNGHSPSLDGYQSRDRKRAYMLVAALWSAVSEHRLTYANPPKSFETLGQKVRRPSTVFQDGLATCLDSSLLFASAIEAIGLNPVVILQHGHCFVGAWLTEKTYRSAIERDCTELRKAIAAQEFIVCETTLITQRPAAPFNVAVQTAVSALRESEEAKFLCAVDIARARMASIRPLASHESHLRFAKQTPTIASTGPLALPNTPEFESPRLDDTEEKPTTPAGRIERWQRKLLDLSLRNRLLNFKESSGVVPFICPDVPYLEDRLAEGIKLKLISYLEDNPIGERDERLHKNRTQRDLLEEFAKAALKRDEIISSLGKSEMTARLTKLFREVKNDLAEGGTNTLFLAVGFLKWKQKSDDERTYRAPLLLIPVQLTRTSAGSPFRLAAYDDDIRFNATLIQLLKKDFGRDLTEFEANLPTDDQGIDVPAILDRVRRKIRDVPGFEVVAEAALSTFSFAKYLMWKDLVDRVGELAKNRVVNHLINDPDKVFSSGVGTPFPEPHHIDVRYHPSELVYPLPADSSQLAAMMAAAEGQDFVLIGPPGTGKSQTIANMIAQCLAGDKTVLFVAEKTAALDVVHRRLREHGLGDCCVELHSNKAERRKFLAQLKNSWDKRRKPPASDWLPISERLKIRRDELNNYVCALHAKDSCGSTVFSAMGKVVRDKHVECGELGWPKTVRMDAKGYAARCELVDKLGSAHSALKPGVAFDSIRTTDWTYAWEQELFQSLAAVETAKNKMAQTFGRFCQTLGFEKQDFALADLEILKRLCGVFQETANADFRIIYDKSLDKLSPYVDQLAEKIDVLQSGMLATRQCYAYDNLAAIPVRELQNDWREANAKVWGLAHMARRRVRLLLQSYSAKGEADPNTDLPTLLKMQEAVGVIEASPLATKTPFWRKHETDVPKLRDHLRIAVQARQVLRQIGEYSGDVNRFAKQIAPAFGGGDTAHPARHAASAFLASLKEFFGTLNGYQKIAGGGLFSRESTKVLAETQTAVERIQQQRTELQRWIAWCEIKKRAIAHGLNASVADLESGRTSTKELRRRFELAYARWWLPQAIDRSPVLRAFQKFKHEDAIRDFKELDQAARAAASSHVTAVTSHDLPAHSTVPKKSRAGTVASSNGVTTSQ